MTAVILIFALSVLAMLLLVFLKPAVHVGRVAISIFWIAPVCGVLALILGGRLGLSEIVAGLTTKGAVNFKSVFRKIFKPQKPTNQAVFRPFRHLVVR